MDTSTQVQPKSVPLRLVIVVLVVVTFLVSGLGLYFGNKLKTCRSTGPKCPELLCASKQRVLVMEKPVEGGRVAGYRLTDDWSTDLRAGVYAVVLETGDLWPVVFSVVDPAHTNNFSTQDNHLFEVIGRKVWVVNSQTNGIDVYDISSNLLGYTKFISLPQYDVGRIYALECGETVCKVSTAHHLESGCVMDLETATESFSNIKCADYGGEFVPERK